jgi:molybdopterin-guanine dinucleotide biosynthesis protein
MVSGTAMNTGKTLAAAELVAGLTNRGLRVAAAKLTGASLMRDVRAMADRGAVCTATYTDAGVVASTGRDMVPIAKGIVAHLSRCAPDCCVLELGDGIIGPYGVDGILQDMELQRFTAAHVLAASDLAGAWAADQLFRKRYRTEIAAVVGPATDTEVGRRYLQNTLGMPGINARSEPERLTTLVAGLVERFAGEGHRLSAIDSRVAAAV